MAIVASTHVLLAGSLLPAVPFVVRMTEPVPVGEMEEAAETAVVPVVGDAMRALQVAVAPPRLYLLAGRRTTVLGPPVILAVAVPLPKVVFTELTVMVSVWLVPTALTAVAGVI